MYKKIYERRAASNTLLIAMLLFVTIIEFMVAIEKVGLFMQALLALCLLINNYKLFGEYEKIIFVLVVIFLGIEIILYQDFGSTLIYLNSILLIICFNNIALPIRKFRRLMLFASIGILLIIITCSREDTSYITIFNKAYNPNMIGVMLFGCMVCGFSAIDKFTIKKICKTIAYIIFSVLIILLQLQTAARTTLLAEVLFIVLFLVRNKIKFFTKDKWYKSLIIFGFFVSLLIPICYVTLYNAYGNEQIVILGKDLFSGRQGIWSDAFEMIKSNPIFGIGNSQLYIGTSESAHNSMLATWKTLGGVLLVIYVTTFVIAKPRRNVAVKSDLIMKVALVPMIFISAFETILTDGHCYIFMLILLLNKTIKNGEQYEK